MPCQLVGSPEERQGAPVLQKRLESCTLCPVRGLQAGTGQRAVGWLAFGQIQRDHEMGSGLWFLRHGRLSLSTVWSMRLLPDVTIACPLTISHGWLTQHSSLMWSLPYFSLIPIVPIAVLCPVPGGQPLFSCIS